jgi:hypothetical protein
VLLAPLAQAADLLADAQPWTPASGQALQSTLYPVGFSPAGAFAWFEELPDEAVGGYLWRFVVWDLVHDRAVEEQRWSERDLATVTSRAGWLARRGADARDALTRAGVTAGPGPARALPMWNGSEAVTTTVEVAPWSRDEPEVSRSTVRVFDAAGRSKAVASVDRRRWGGVTVDTSPPTPVAWFASPFEARAALVSVVVRRGYEGPPHVVSVVVTGVHLVSGFE